MSVSLSGYGVTLIPVTQAHLEQLRRWRNDPAISEFMLIKEEISSEQQLAWFNGLTKKASEQHFVICYKNQAIGAANIKEQQRQPIKSQRQSNHSQVDARQMNQANSTLRLEPGIYLGEEKFRNNVLAFAPSLVLLDYCFNDLHVSALYATVHQRNSAALNYNQKLGYKITDEDGEWVKITLTPADYDEATNGIKQFLSKRLRR